MTGGLMQTLKIIDYLNGNTFSSAKNTFKNKEQLHCPKTTNIAPKGNTGENQKK